MGFAVVLVPSLDGDSHHNSGRSCADPPIGPIHAARRVESPAVQDNRRNSVSDGSDTAPVADLIDRAYLYGLDAVPEQECRELRERLATDCAARAEFRR